MKKILLSSDCNGNFQLLFSKVSQLHQKNKFDLMFLTGNVCPIQSAQQYSKLLKGQIKVPLPTYFINSSSMSKIFNLTYPDGSQLVQNFTFLGKKGMKNIMGLNVVYVNGLSYSKQQQMSCQGLSQNVVRQIIEKYSNDKIDILLTNQWPSQIRQIYRLKQQKQSTGQNPKFSNRISQISYQLSPKYHLSGSGNSFYRLDPFKNKKGSFTHFINVGQMNKTNLTGKYLLAIQTIPFQLNPPEQSVTNVIQYPFKKSTSIKGNQRQHQQSQNGNTNFIQEQKNQGYRQKFNLSKYEQKSRQGITSIDQINSDIYVYFDNVPFQSRSYDIQQFLQRWGKVIKFQLFKQQKGNNKSGIAKFSSIQQTKQCLADSGKYSLHQNRIKFKPKTIQQKYHNQDCWFCQKNNKFDKSLLIYKHKYSMICLDKGPITQIHLQLIPINHVNTLGKLQSIEIDQIINIKSQLKRYFCQNGYQVIICQRYMKLSEQISHCILQVLAVKEPTNLVYKFYQLNKEQRFNFNSLKPSQQNNWIRKSQYFIKIQINEHVFVKQINQKQKVQFDFMRKIICELLNKPQKINWRNCERKQQSDIKKDKQNIQKILKQCNLIVQ